MSHIYSVIIHDNTSVETESVIIHEPYNNKDCEVLECDNWTDMPIDLIDLEPEEDKKFEDGLKKLFKLKQKYGGVLYEYYSGTEDVIWDLVYEKPEQTFVPDVTKSIFNKKEIIEFLNKHMQVQVDITDEDIPDVVAQQFVDSHNLIHIDDHESYYDLAVNTYHEVHQY